MEMEIDTHCMATREIWCKTDITEDINLLGVSFGETVDSTFSTFSKNVDVPAKQGLH